MRLGPASQGESSLTDGNGAADWESLLPDQLSGARPAAWGARALMAAVLVDAIKHVTGRSGPRRQALAGEAERWIRSDDRRWPFSFSNICLMLDVDPRRLREAILRRASRPEGSPENGVGGSGRATGRGG